MEVGMIIGVASVLDEAPIIRQTVTHLFNSGADLIIVSDGGSTDGTQQVLSDVAHNMVPYYMGGNKRLIVIPQEGPLHQDVEMTRLAHMAQDLGATWIVPFDADEFWCNLSLLDLLDRQQDLSVPIGRVQATMWQHTTWNHRHRNPKPLPKVAFRPVPGMRITWGNHDVHGIPGGITNGLAIRELQYRDWDHFVAKIDKAARLFAISDFPIEYGSHMRRLVAMTDMERREEWAAMQAVPTVYDPIPYLGE